MSGLSTSRATADPTPSGGLILATIENGQSTSGRPQHGHFDVCPTWMELSIRHLKDAQVGQVARDAARNGADEYAWALEWEFEASMQAIMASANALDAFCAAVRARVQLPQLLIDEWHEKRTQRYVQIAEILRRGLSLTAKDAVALRQNLGEIFRFRDLSIDPSPKIDAPILHPVLGVGVEWRYAYFRYENALLIVKATLRLIAKLVAMGGPKDAEVQRYVDALRPRIEALQDLKAFGMWTPASDAHPKQET